MSPKIPLNLSHAANIAGRIEYRLRNLYLAEPSRLTLHLAPWHGRDDTPPEEESGPVVEEAASIARAVVDRVEERKAADDRLGQLIRNLFECLGQAEEGAALSLRAGEKPDSPLRPR